MEQQGFIDSVISDRTDSPYTVLPGGVTALAVFGLFGWGGGDRSSGSSQSCSDPKTVMAGGKGEDDRCDLPFGLVSDHRA